MATDFKQAILHGQTALGIELGSTRIKAVLIDHDGAVIASGAHDWENRLENGLWTYALDDIHTGLQGCYRDLTVDVHRRYGVSLETVGAIGISAMMHGYLPFDADGALLVPFRTWRNTTTGEAAAQLTQRFDFNIPLRWSIAHLYQAMLDGEPHVKDIAYLTTLSGYIHWRLTGQKVLGVGDASGMFPIDSTTHDFDKAMCDSFNTLVADKAYPWTLAQIFPQVLCAGEAAGSLTAQGAALLDPSGSLRAGIPFCPPEGDAGTGMVATNAVAPKTGNVSAGTSIFAMVVLEKKLTQLHPEIDMVTTPSGAPVAMAHCNTCTSEVNAWVSLFREVADTFGCPVDTGSAFTALFNKALEEDPDCGGLLTYNYHAGEPVTGIEQGRPLFARTPDAAFTLSNFMRAQLYSSVATLKLGMDILFEQEHVVLDKLLGHGGFFKTPTVGQTVMAAALGVPVSVMETAGEGGPWGMAVLAAYMHNAAATATLDAYLADTIFVGAPALTVTPDKATADGFAAFMARYERGLAIERTAADVL